MLITFAAPAAAGTAITLLFTTPVSLSLSLSLAFSLLLSRARFGGPWIYCLQLSVPSASRLRGLLVRENIRQVRLVSGGLAWMRLTDLGMRRRRQVGELSDMFH